MIPSESCAPPYIDKYFSFNRNNRIFAEVEILSLPVRSISQNENCRKQTGTIGNFSHEILLLARADICSQGNDRLDIGPILGIQFDRNNRHACGV